MGVRSSVWHVPGKIPGYRLVAKSNHFYLPQALGEFLIVGVEDLTYDDVTCVTSFAKHSNSLNGKGKENYTTEKETESLQYERV